MTDVKIRILTEDDTSAANNKIVGSFTELNSIIEIGKKAWGELKQIYNETVGQAVNLANTQKDLARQMGVSVEQAGVFAKVSEDLRVDQSTLTLAFKALNKEGMQPNIETPRSLAQQYQDLPDSVSKNQFAVEKFGRAGVEMEKILEVTPADLPRHG